MKPVARWFTLAALALTLTMATPSGAHAEVVADSNVNQAGTTIAAPRVATAAAAAAVVTVVYPRAGEGLISLTSRTCGTATTWRQQATANRVYGPSFVIYLGRAYTVSCTRTVTTATRSTVTRSVSRTWVHPLPGVYGHPGGCWGDARYDKYGNRRSHKGVDLSTWRGRPVHAAAAGRVTRAGWIWGGYGISVTINHGSVSTHYAHMSREIVYAGQSVRAGQVIGYVGSTGNSTGPHTHFEVATRPSVLGYQINPARFMRARGVNVGCS